jgi:hypothetical protein
MKYKICSVMSAPEWKQVGLLIFGLAWSCVSLAQGEEEGTDIVETMIEEQVALEASARQSQITIAKLDEEAGRLLAEYRQVLAETESLNTYNDQMDSMVSSQEEEKLSIARQFAEIDTTSREVVPLMQRMLATLEQFVVLDMPFLQQERQQRIASLKDIMGRADVSTSEKFRRILEAYGVEMEYGRTIESYRDVMMQNGVEITVDFLRLGRVALLYQSLDGKQTGYWDRSRNNWVAANDFQRPVRQGLRIAMQQAAPDLISVPVSGPQEN